MRENILVRLTFKANQDKISLVYEETSKKGKKKSFTSKKFYVKNDKRQKKIF